MEIKEKLNELLHSDKKVKILIIVAFAGILIILLSEMTTHDSSAKIKSEECDYTSYVESLEEKTEKVLSLIAGVGKCRVMITLRNTNESVYAQNSDISRNNSSYSEKYEYVFYDGSNGDEPVLIKQYMPEIQGVAVVCEGGDNPLVAENIISALSSLYNVSSSKISISKLG